VECGYATDFLSSRFQFLPFMKFGKNTLHLISLHVHLLNTVIIQQVVHSVVYGQHSMINGKYCSGHNSLHVKRVDILLNNQPDTLIIPILFCYKTLHVSGIFSAHHQEFSTVHLALVSFVQVSDDRFQAESGWNCVPS